MFNLVFFFTLHADWRAGNGGETRDPMIKEDGFSYGYSLCQHTHCNFHSSTPQLSILGAVRRGAENTMSISWVKNATYHFETWGVRLRLLGLSGRVNRLLSAYYWEQNFMSLDPCVLAFFSLRASKRFDGLGFITCFLWAIDGKF